MDEKVYNALKIIKKDIEISRNMSVNAGVDLDKKIHNIEVKIDSIEKNMEKAMSG